MEPRLYAVYLQVNGGDTYKLGWKKLIPSQTLDCAREELAKVNGVPSDNLFVLEDFPIEKNNEAEFGVADASVKDIAKKGRYGISITQQVSEPKKDAVQNASPGAQASEDPITPSVMPLKDQLVPIPAEAPLPPSQPSQQTSTVLPLERNSADTLALKSLTHPYFPCLSSKQTSTKCPVLETLTFDCADRGHTPLEGTFSCTAEFKLQGVKEEPACLVASHMTAVQDVLDNCTDVLDSSSNRWYGAVGHPRSPISVAESDDPLSVMYDHLHSPAPESHPWLARVCFDADCVPVGYYVSEEHATRAVYRMGMAFDNTCCEGEDEWRGEVASHQAQRELVGYHFQGTDPASRSRCVNRTIHFLHMFEWSQRDVELGGVGLREQAGATEEQEKDLGASSQRKNTDRAVERGAGSQGGVGRDDGEAKKEAEKDECSVGQRDASNHDEGDDESLQEIGKARMGGSSNEGKDHRKIADDYKLRDVDIRQELGLEQEEDESEEEEDHDVEEGDDEWWDKDNGEEDEEEEKKKKSVRNCPKVRMRGVRAKGKYGSIENGTSAVREAEIEEWAKGTEAGELDLNKEERRKWKKYLRKCNYRIEVQVYVSSLSHPMAHISIENNWREAAQRRDMVLFALFGEDGCQPLYFPPDPESDFMKALSSKDGACIGYRKVPLDFAATKRFVLQFAVDGSRRNAWENSKASLDKAKLTCDKATSSPSWTHHVEKAQGKFEEFVEVSGKNKTCIGSKTSRGKAVNDGSKENSNQMGYRRVKRLLDVDMKEVDEEEDSQQDTDGTRLVRVKKQKADNMEKDTYGKYQCDDEVGASSGR